MNSRGNDVHQVDQVVRRQAFQAAHPEVRITAPAPLSSWYWTAAWTDRDGHDAVITANDLCYLLDDLDAAFGAQTDREA
jgi:hypothetical protein